MRIFSNPGLFAEHLLKVAGDEIIAAEVGLKACADLIEKSAKDEIGHLQPAVGPYESWEPLADSTLADKERKGYIFNSDGNPLLRTGELQASIGSEVNGLEATIGSTSQIMVYQEYGTIKMPPRAVIGPAGFKNRDKIIEILTLALASGFSGSMTLPFIGAVLSTEL